MHRCSNFCLSLVALLVPLFVANSLVLYAQASPFEDISYSKGTFFGGIRNDSYLLHVAVDDKGFIYGTGFCTDIPTTGGAYQKNCGGSFDVMVFKMDPTMTTLIWATYIGGTESDAGGSIAVNAAGEVFVSGYTYSPNFPISVPTDKPYLTNGQVCVFALKLSADGGQLMYSRILGNGAPVQQQSQNASKGAFICVNPRNEAYVYSYIPSGAPFSITNNAFQRSPGGAFDLVLTRLDANGLISYSTYIGGSGGDVARDMCYAKGKVYLCGATSSPNFPRNTVRVPLAFDSFIMVVDDILVPRIRKSFVYGSSGNDFGTSLCYDSHANRLLLTGTAEYGNIPATKVLQPTQIAGGYVAGIDSGLTRIQFLSMLGTGLTPTSVAARSNSNIYIAGYVIGTVPVTPNAFQPTTRGDIDGALLTLDSSGSNVRYGTFVGGNAPDYSAAKVLIYESGCVLRVIFGITTHSLNFPSSTDSFQPMKLNGGEDQGALVLFSTTGDVKMTMSSKTCAREYTFGLAAACPPLDILWDFGDGSVPVHGFGPMVHRYDQPGKYAVIVKLAYAKPDTVMVRREIFINGPAGIDAGPNQTICIAGSKVQLRAIGSMRVSWYPSKLFADSTQRVQEVTPKTTTTYYVRGSDSTGCESIDSVTIYVLDKRSFAAKDTALCEGQSAILRLATNSQVNWLPAEGLNTTVGSTVVITATKSQTYTAIISEGPCADTAQFNLVVHPQPHVTMPPPQTLCFKNSAILQASAYGQYSGDTVGLKIQWSPVSNITSPTSLRTIVTPTKTTVYKLTITSRFGCTKVDSVKITVQNALPLKVIADTVICNGNAIRMWATGASKYRWYPATGLSDATLASPLCTVKQTTTYTVVANSGSCVDSAVVTVRVGNIPKVTARGDTTVCGSDRVCLRVAVPENGVVYSWSPAADFENPIGSSVYLHTTTSKTYTVTARSSGGCTATSTSRVQINNAIVVSAAQDAPVCEGETTVLRLKGAVDTTLHYTWIPNDGVFDPATGSYRVVAKANQSYLLRVTRGSCLGTTLVPVSVKPAPAFTLTTDTTVCEGRSLLLIAKTSDKSLRFRWEVVDGDSTLIVGRRDSSLVRLNGLDSSRMLKVTADKAGCQLSRIVRVHLHPTPELSAPPDASICVGERVMLQIASPGMRSVVWEPSNGLSSPFAAKVIASPTQTTNYRISVVDSFGCTNSTTLQIRVRANTTLRLSLNSFYAKSGDEVSLVVRGRADQDLHSALDFDVVCDATIFEPTDSTAQKIVNGQRVMHVHFDSARVNGNPRDICVIRGVAMLSAEASSDVRIHSERLEADICPVILTTPGTIVVSSCYYGGRQVRLIDSLTMAVAPSPATESTILDIRSDELGTVLADLYDISGQLVREWTLSHDGSHTQHPLSLPDLSSGSYILRARLGSREKTLTIIKLQ